MRHPVVRLQTVLGVVMCMALGSFIGQRVPRADRTLDLPPATRTSAY